MSPSRYPFFAAISPGLEPLLLDEWLREVPDAGGSARRGGVSGRGTLEEIRDLALKTRLAESLRVRIGTFEARDFGALEEGVGKIAWHAWVPEGTIPSIRVTCRKSKLYHSGAVEQRVRQVMDQSLRHPPTETHGTLHVRLVKDRATLSLDVAGERLHKRGWRGDVAIASFRETLAAAMLAASGWRPEQPLWDPFCGAGTIVLEAATQAAGVAPREQLALDLERWPVARTLTERSSTPAPVLEGLPAFVGSDKSSAAIKAAHANTIAAGVGVATTWKTADVERAAKHAPQGAAVVSNLPYGKRLASGDAVTAALRGFSSALRCRPDLGPVLVMTNREGLSGATGLTWEQAFRTTNRGIDVYGLRLVR